MYSQKANTDLAVWAWSSGWFCMGKAYCLETFQECRSGCLLVQPLQNPVARPRMLL